MLSVVDSVSCSVPCLKETVQLVQALHMQEMTTNGSSPAHAGNQVPAVQYSLPNRDSSHQVGLSPAAVQTFP